ncbi:MAG: B12-binding domain-containing radical SAM protein [Candidatus Saganbacteria bacterium]|nr:B12-binding domain-containing radical SAM protein [Candidatus Saganbacteria bacterium]
MKICLVEFSLGPKIPKAGILALATYLNNRGHKIPLVDLGLTPKSQIRQPSFFKNRAKKILRYKPDAIGFSTVSNSLPSFLLIAKHCKKLAPKTPIIFGGPEVSFEEIPLLKTFPQVDIVVRGEGEISLSKLCEALEQKQGLSTVMGITYRKKGRIIRNPDQPLIRNLDDLPLPDFSLIPNLNKYSGVLVEAGRGCPYHCTFCSTCKMWGERFRIKSPKRLVQEIKKASRISKVDIIHDNLLVNRRWTEVFLGLMAKEKIEWNCTTRLDLLNKNLIKKLKRANCRHIYLGIESGSKKIQKQINKNLNIETLLPIIKALSQNRIKCGLYFIIGLPGEKTGDINQTLQLALESRQNSNVSVVHMNHLTIFKGSKLYLQAKRYKNKIRPLQTTLFEEYSLIKNHPDIFPSFFYFKFNRASPEFLENLSILYTLLLDYFPKTTLMIVKAFSITPYKLGTMAFTFFEKEKINWEPYWKQKENNNLYLKYFILSIILFLKSLLDSRHGKQAAPIIEMLKLEGKRTQK